MSAVWRAELGDSACEEGLADRLVHPSRKGGPTTRCTRPRLRREKTAALLHLVAVS